MLRIYSVVIELVRRLAPVIVKVEKHDPDLARQMRRALASVPLNVAEGSHGRGKLRGLRYATAAGSLRETFAGVDTAIAFGYIPPLDPEIGEMQRAVIGTLVKCMR